MKAQEYRNGYQLQAEKEEESGVKIESAFLLSAENKGKVSADTVKQKLQITPKVDFDTEVVKQGIRIIPKEKLKENTVYAFVFEGTTWLLQTEGDFYLQAVLPAHEAVQVPTDTGIEFVFSVAGASDLDKYIEIMPKVSGRFEQKGNLAIFIPSQRLKEKTVYTVKVKAGLPLKNSDKTLKEDTAFQFETADKPSIIAQREETESLGFQTWQNEVAIGDKPVFALSYYKHLKEQTGDIKVKVELYRYATAQEYMQGLGNMANLPIWAN